MGIFNSRRRYKIYINDRPLYICDREDAKAIKYGSSETTLKLPYRSKSKLLLQCIDNLEKGGMDCVILLTEDPRSTFKDLKKLYKIISASGGAVVHEDGDLLVIHRNDVYDLPKGKREKGESNKECAIREVLEETGLEEVSIKEKIGKTYHTYRTNEGLRVLKTNHWYLMAANSKAVRPQQEEGIQDVIWIKPQTAPGLSPLYKSVRDVIEEVS